MSKVSVLPFRGYLNVFLHGGTLPNHYLTFKSVSDHAFLWTIEAPYGSNSAKNEIYGSDYGKLNWKKGFLEKSQPKNFKKSPKLDISSKFEDFFR